MNPIEDVPDELREHLSALADFLRHRQAVNKSVTMACFEGSNFTVIVLDSKRSTYHLHSIQ